jgi:hypothetical protein
MRRERAFDGADPRTRILADSLLIGNSRYSLLQTLLTNRRSFGVSRLLQPNPLAR